MYVIKHKKSNGKAVSLHGLLYTFGGVYSAEIQKAATFKYFYIHAGMTALEKHLNSISIFQDDVSMLCPSISTAKIEATFDGAGLGGKY